MPLNLDAVLYQFFIQGFELDRIAAIHETSWSEVTKVLDSEPARELMRSALRVERFRAAAESLAVRRCAFRSLGAFANSLDQSPSGLQSRRRAAAAIISGTKPGRNNKPPRTNSPPRAAANPKPPLPSTSPTQSHVQPKTQSTPQSKTQPTTQSKTQPANQLTPAARKPSPTTNAPPKTSNSQNQFSPRNPPNQPAAKSTTKPAPKSTTRPTRTPSQSARSHATAPPSRATPSVSSTTRSPRHPTRKPHHRENSS